VDNDDNLHCVYVTSTLRYVTPYCAVQLLAEERNKNRVLRETLDTRERTIIELQTRINELMKVSSNVCFC